MRNLEEEDTDRVKPFKLSFAEKNLPGRSDIQIDKPLHLPHVITPKFYVKPSPESEQHKEIANKYLEKLNVKGPREKYVKPITENQKYGWYQIRFTDADPKDRRLNFHKRTNILIIEHLMNYAKIR